MNFSFAKAKFVSNALILAVSAIGVMTMANNVLALDLQGHRGARGLLPENTLAGFARALSIGVNTLELDVGMTKDNVVVVSHNPQLAPETTRNGKGHWLEETGPALRSITLAQVKTYDVGRIKEGTRYHQRYPDQVPVDGARIPTLAEVLELINKSGNKTIRLNIETKLSPNTEDIVAKPESFAAAVVAIVRDLGFDRRVTIQSFDWRTLKVVQQLAPAIPTSYLTVNRTWLNNIQKDQPGASPWMAGFDVDDYGGDIAATIKAAGGRIWSPYHRDIGKSDIDRAHTLGLLVKVWTVNDQETMSKMIDLGVDGIITDYPDRLRALLRERGMEVAKPTPVTP